MNFDEIDKLIKEKKIKKAQKLLTKIKKTSDSLVNFKTVMYQALCYKYLNQSDLAIINFKQAIAIAQSIENRISAMRLLAQEYYIKNEWKLVAQVYKDILVLDDSFNTSDIRLHYCKVCLELGNYKEVEEYIGKLLSLSEHYAKAQEISCECAIKSLNKPLALKRLQQFTNNINSIPPESVAYIIHAYIRLNDIDKSRNLIVNCAKKHEGENWFKVLTAAQAMEENQYELVIKTLKGIDVGEHLSFDLNEFYYPLLATAHEKLGDFEKSHYYFEQQSHQTKTKLLGLKVTDHLKSYKNVKVAELPTYTGENSEPNIVFMVGFPRSGTTLLETIIDTHEQIITLSEAPTIANVIAEINMLKKQKYPLSLKLLSQEDLLYLRNVYFDNVAKLIGEFSNGMWVIDKMPLNTIHLPLINVLFPWAKIIFNIRHPLDVIYSNFQQNYAINNEMSFLVTINGIAQRYKQVFDFYNKIKKEVELDVLEMRYEDLVENIDFEYSRLMSFLTLSINENFKEHSTIAKAKVINTASKNQVSKPLYSTSVYKWKNYESHLKDSATLINEYIVKYGYEE